MQLYLRFPLPHKQSLQQWRGLLLDKLPFDLLEVDPPQHYRVHYFDSFDWRCYRAGETLEWHGRCNTPCLLVRSRSDESVIENMPLDHPPSRFPTDLPHGRLRKMLRKRLGPRAMLPVAVIDVHSQSLGMTGKKLKPHVFLTLSQYCIHEPGERAAILYGEIRIEAAPQHMNKARKLAVRIQEQFGLSGDRQSLLDIALARLGKPAAGYSSRLDIPLEAGLRTDTAMRKIMLALLDTMETNEAGTIGDIDTEFLHDFRVAVRRTRTALIQMKSVMAPHTLDRFVEAFAWLGNITTPTRDLDIHLLKFNTLKKSIPENLRNDLEPLRECLQTQQRQEQARLANALRSATYRELKEHWHHFLSAELPHTPPTIKAASPIRELADRKTWRMYKRVLREGRTITFSSPATDLHKLRKSCKKLRYLMEFFKTLYPPKIIRQLIRELKNLQDNLGNFQDLQVQARALERYREKINRTGTMQAPTRLAIDTLLDRLQSAATGVRNGFELRFECFSRKLNRRRFRRLFHTADQHSFHMS